jgi:hypothetical protein
MSDFNNTASLTSYVTGPDDGVASPLAFGGILLLRWLNLNSVARSGARGVGRHKSSVMRVAFFESFRS